MPFFIAISALFVLSAGYLLYQYLSRAFVADAPIIDSAADPDGVAEALRAA
jgi:hypothetical protein